MNTARLIERLALDVERVRPLRRPWMRAALWSVAAMLYASLLALLFTSNEDFSINTAIRPFVAQQAAAILMACCASVAACASVVPGYSRWVFVLPVLGVATWLATLLASVPSEWSHVKLAGLADRHELLCVPMITLTALPLAAALTLMLSRGAPLNPRVSVALSLLAAAGMTNAVTCLASPHQSAIAVLAWHGSTLLVLSLLAVWMGRAVLPWSLHDKAAL